MKLMYNLKKKDILFSLDFGVTINGESYVISPISFCKELKHNFSLVNKIT